MCYNTKTNRRKQMKMVRNIAIVAFAASFMFANVGFHYSNNYQNMDDARKKVMLEEVLKRVKSKALDRLKGAMAQDDPELLRQYMIEQRTTKSQEGLLQQMGVIP